MATADPVIDTVAVEDVEAVAGELDYALILPEIL
jgi:hypothetical protein